MNELLRRYNVETPEAAPESPATSPARTDTRPLSAPRKRTTATASRSGGDVVSRGGVSSGGVASGGGIVSSGGVASGGGGVSRGGVVSGGGGVSRGGVASGGGATSRKSVGGGIRNVASVPATRHPAPDMYPAAASHEAKFSGIFGGNADGRPSGPSFFEGIREKLPELWGVDLTMILITLFGLALIGLNFNLILLEIARVIFSLLEFGLLIAVILGFIACSAFFLRRRR